jgi:hypothetical protein
VIRATGAAPAVPVACSWPCAPVLDHLVGGKDRAPRAGREMTRPSPNGRCACLQRRDTAWTELPAPPHLPQSEGYVRGDIHISTVDGFWALVKNGIGGVYHGVSTKHLQAYSDEYAFRYNNRKDPRGIFNCVALSRREGWG